MAGVAQQGLILIPHFSGFDEFIGDVELAHSQHIMADLMEMLVDANQLGLTLSELDGEALFFYGYDAPPSLEQLTGQARDWTLGFHRRLNALKRDIYCDCGACVNVSRLGLRIVGHYGEFGEHRLRNKTLVVGKEVILARKLMDNSISTSDYLLISEPLMEKIGIKGGRNSSFERIEQTFPVFGTIPLGFQDLTGLREEAPPAPEREPVLGLKEEIAEEVNVNAPLEKAAGILTDFESWPDWVDGLSHLDMDFSAPLRSGSRHICVSPKQTQYQTVENIVKKNDEFSLITRVTSPVPMIKNLIMVFSARQASKGILLRMCFNYEPKPYMGWLVKKTKGGKFRAQIHNSLQNLKGLLEG